MIIGHSKHWGTERAFAPPVLQQTMDRLLNMDVSHLEQGTYPIQGEDIYVNVMEPVTKWKQDQPAEKHERFIDIHYLLQGREMIGWRIYDSGLIASKPYDSEGDYALYDDLPGETEIHLTTGMYAVMFPEDVHRPLLAEEYPEPIRKAVVKIRADLFAL